MDIKGKFSIIVPSCDKYSDLWKPFFDLFFRFWPDCPFKIYLLTDRLNINIPNVEALPSGNYLSWSDSLINALNHIEEDYVFLFLEDLFLLDFVNTDSILEIFEWILRVDANYVRLNPSPKPDRYYNKLIGIISKGIIYRASTVLSIWKKDVLLDLLQPGESAWDFEIYGSVRSDKYDSFYSVRKRYFYYINGVVKGKWQRGAVKKLNSLGIEVNLEKRKMMSLEETIGYYLKRQRSNLFKIIPLRFRRKVKDFILRGKYDYKLKE